MHSGLTNLNNTCFLNAAMQSFISSPSAISCLHAASTLAQDTTMLTELQKLERMIRTHPQPAIVNMKEGFYKTIPVIFQNEHQHDVCDLFGGLMDSLSTPELPSQKRRSASSSVQSLTSTVFTGATQETFRCTSCSFHEVKVPVDFRIVVLPVNGNQSGSPVPLKQFFFDFNSPGALPNKTCSRCRSNNTTTSTTAFTTAPPSLMVQLIRFDHTMTKQFYPVSFPYDLDLPGIAASYSLVAVTRHLSSPVGTQHGGHYVADVKEADASWWRCDDESVTPSLNPTGIGSIDNTPYLLHYEKKLRAGAELGLREIKHNKTTTKKRDRDKREGEQGERR
jgi:ubiquitin C-terminal hydrolase